MAQDVESSWPIALLSARILPAGRALLVAGALSLGTMYISASKIALAVRNESFCYQGVSCA